MMRAGEEREMSPFGRRGLRAFALLVPFLSAALAASAQESDDPRDAESTWFRQANVGYGPFHQTSLSPFTSLRLNLVPYFPSAFPEGMFEFELSTGWGKNNSSSDLWDIDFEVVASNVSFAWAVSDRVRVSMEIVSGERTGGGLDPLILGFHQTFGLPLNDRSRHPKNDFVFDVNAPDVGPPVHLDKDDPQPFVESVLMTFQHTVTYGNDVLPAFTYAIQLRGKLGGGGDLEEASPVDVLVSVAASKDLSAGVRVYAGGIVGWYGRDDFFGIRLRTWQWSVLVAAEWACLPDFSLIVQDLITGGAVEGLRDFSLPSHEVSGGFKWEIGRGMLFEVALIENIINFENSPDLGFHFALTVRW